MSRFPHKKKGRGWWLARKFHSRSKCSISIEIWNFFDLWALWEVLSRDIRANDPRMSAGYPARKLPLWAAFSFQNCSALKTLSTRIKEIKEIFSS